MFAASAKNSYSKTESLRQISLNSNLNCVKIPLRSGGIVCWNITAKLSSVTFTVFKNLGGPDGTKTQQKLKVKILSIVVLVRSVGSISGSLAFGSHSCARRVNAQLGLAIW